MKNIFAPLFFLLSMLLSADATAQKKITAKQASIAAGNMLDKIFTRYAIFDIDAKDLAGYAKAQVNNNIQFDLQLEGYPLLPFSISRHKLLSDNYQLTVADASGTKISGRPNCLTYSGTLADDAGSSVYLTLSDSLIYGFINNSHHKFFIEPLRYFDKTAPGNRYVFYETKDVRPQLDITCGAKEVEERLQQQDMEMVGRGSATGTCRVVEIAIASDDSMYFKYGTVQAVQEHNIAVANSMAGIFSNTQIGTQYLEFRIRGQYISLAAAANPYLPLLSGNVADVDVLLPAFASWGEAGKFGFTDYDMAQVWTTRNIAIQTLPGSGIYSYSVVGYAYIGGACNSRKYQLLEDWAYFSGVQLATLSAHETGHNLNASHDNSTGYIMNAIIDDPPATGFSPESITVFNNYINGSGGSCFSSCDAGLPNAAFSASPPNICTGRNIVFRDYSTGAVTSRTWIFPGGTPSGSNAPAEAVTYNTPGMKTVTLTVTNATGNTSITQSVFVGNDPLPACRTSIAGNNERAVFLSFNLADIRLINEPLTTNGRYDNYTCLYNSQLLPGTTYTGKVNMGSADLSISNHLEIFIDYNGDGDFSDAGESVFFSPSCFYGDYTFSFTTPALVPATNQWLTMRVIARPCSLPTTNGCNIPANAQVKDFAVSFAMPDTCIMYVNAAATGANNGTSWANAFTDLQAALASSSYCAINQVWVAAGTYKPTQTGNRELSFALKNGTAIYGGFPASGTPGFADRNPALYTTTLSGDIGAAGVNDNSFHVVRNAALDSTAVLDGFYISDGNANGFGDLLDAGGGMLNDPAAGFACTPRIVNCIFINNNAVAGAAVYNDGSGSGNNSSPEFINCVFRDNTAVINGGAVYNNGTASGTSSPRFMNCSFYNNSAQGSGAVMHNIANGGTSQPLLRNCIVFGNGSSAAFSNSSAAGVVAGNCFLQTGISNYTSAGANIISAVSPFVGPGYLQLQDTSPAIDAGAAAGAPLKDITGAARLSLPDIGAYENVQSCYGADKIFYANIAGIAYQWQKDEGNGYTDISNNTMYSNVTTNKLTVIAPARQTTGTRYRCRVIAAGGAILYSDEHVLRFYNRWTGVADNNWQNAANWGCGILPDEYTDVILPASKDFYPSVNVQGAVRKLQAENGSAITLTTGNHLQITGND
ncbi:MAG: choice-of-anchor Q domain-containing protein [Ferruginibacter sp.]